MKIAGGDFLLFVLMAATASTLTAAPGSYSVPFNRSLFPHDFLFGAGSSAYQVPKMNQFKILIFTILSQD